MKKDIVPLASDAYDAAGTTYGDWIDVSYYTELMLVLAVTAQGAYTNETMDVTIQGSDPLGNVVNLGQFTQVGNVTSSLPYTETMKLSNFGGRIRAKIVVAGTAVAYTASVSGFAKRESD